MHLPWTTMLQIKCKAITAYYAVIYVQKHAHPQYCYSLVFIFRKTLQPKGYIAVTLLTSTHLVKHTLLLFHLQWWPDNSSNLFHMIA